MKKCPFCQADIEDNARFCVFCMSSLQEKQKIEIKTKSKTKWPIFTAISGIFAAIGGIFAAIGGVAFVVIVSLLVALALIISMLFLGKNNTNNNSSLSYVSEQIFTSDNANVTGNDEVIIGKDDTENTKDTTTQIDTNDDHSNETDSSNGNGDSSNKNSSNSSVNSNSTTINSSENSSTANSSTVQTSDSNNSSSQSSNVDSSTVPTYSEVTYTYRDATASDCYPPGHDIYTVENVIVITGVSSVSSNGIYIVPEKIDGKKVGAIMPGAFSDPAVSSTVKKVVLPSTVRTIWENAFSNCYNLTDIYLHSKVIAIYELALPDVSKRTGTITIHCTRDCRNFEFYYYRNITDKYGAQYKEWNGGDIE